MPKISGFSTSEPLAPPKGSGAGGIAPDKAGPVGESLPSSASSGDQVTLTQSARSLQKLSAAVAQAPAVDSAKVASVKQSLANGTYQIDPASIANKLLQLESGLK